VSEIGERITADERRQSKLLWIGVLTGPIAWSAQILVNYNLEEMNCSLGVLNHGRAWGVGVGTIITSVNVLLAAATFGAGLTALACWRKIRRAGPGRAVGGRPLWMAGAGMMVSGLFLIMIGFGFAGPFILKVCDPSL
jgi:hypothetical protein